MPRQAPHRRRDFEHFLAIPTRWTDNDVYGHVNNVVCYSYFDTADAAAGGAKRGAAAADAHMTGIPCHPRNDDRPGSGMDLAGNIAEILPQAALQVLM
jgi:hypothetical protein